MGQPADKPEECAGQLAGPLSKRLPCPGTGKQGLWRAPGLDRLKKSGVCPGPRQELTAALRTSKHLGWSKGHTAGPH